MLLVPLNGVPFPTTLSTPASGMVRPLIVVTTSAFIGRRQLSIVAARIACTSIIPASTLVGIPAIIATGSQCVAS